MPHHEQLQQNIKKLPEGSKAEKIQDGVEKRLTEITTIINEGHPSLARLELQKVGQRILVLFDELLDELPSNTENKPETTTHSITSEDLGQDGKVIGDNRSERFWEIDHEIGVLTKKFEELYEEQGKEPQLQTDGFVINPDKHSIN